MSDSSLVTVPATSTSIQQVFSIPHTAPTLSQSSLGLSEKGVSCQSHPTVSTCCLVSPESFSSKVKVTGNGSCGDALATAGSVNNILQQSLFSSIEPKPVAAQVPAGAFSLAEVENKLRTEPAAPQRDFKGEKV